MVTEEWNPAVRAEDPAFVTKKSKLANFKLLL